MKTVLIVLLACAAYATLRYNVFQGVAWSEWPVFVANKACALASVVLLMLQVMRQRGAAAVVQADLLVSAWMLMLAHVGLSLTLLGPAYYAKFFQGEKLTAWAGWSLLLGAAAAVALHKQCRACELSQAVGFSRKVGPLAFVVGLHAALPGYASWFAPSTWPGFLPPITLLSFLAGTVALAAAVYPCRRAP